MFFSFFGFFENISKTWVKNWVATKVLQMIESNNYVIKLPLNFETSDPSCCYPIFDPCFDKFSEKIKNNEKQRKFKKYVF